MVKEPIPLAQIDIEALARGEVDVDDTPREAVTLAREIISLRAELSHERWLREQSEALCIAVQDQREALRDENERLRKAINQHRLDVWGHGTVGHPCDIELYATLAAECTDEEDCTHMPWCKIREECQRAALSSEESKQKAEWRVEYDNDWGVDERFREWWRVTNGERTFNCDDEATAKWLQNLLQYN